MYGSSGDDGGGNSEGQEAVHQNKQPSLKVCQIATAANMNKILSAQR